MNTKKIIPNIFVGGGLGFCLIPLLMIIFNLLYGSVYWVIYGTWATVWIWEDIETRASIFFIFIGAIIGLIGALSEPGLVKK